MRTIYCGHRAWPLACLTLLFTACGNVGDAPQADLVDAFATARLDGVEIPIDTARSSINWRAAKVTRAHDGGFHAFDGSVVVDDGLVTGARVEIDARSIWSDAERLTTHLKSADFFDVETHPTAVFESVEIVPVDSAGATHLVTGNLTMNGVSNGVRFPVSIRGETDDVHVAADFIIDRTRWGITYSGRADDLIENDVRLMFDLYASSSAVPEMSTLGPERSDEAGVLVN